MAEVHIVDIDGEQWDIKDLPLTQRVAIIEQRNTFVNTSFTKDNVTYWLSKRNGIVTARINLIPSEEQRVNRLDLSDVLPEGYIPFYTYEATIVLANEHRTIGHAVLRPNNTLTWFLEGTTTLVANKTYAFCATFAVNN